MASTVYKHSIAQYVKTEAANYDKVTASIRGSYLMHAMYTLNHS